MSLRVSFTQEDIDKANELTDATLDAMTEENCANLHNFMEGFERSIQWDLAQAAIQQRMKRA